MNLTKHFLAISGVLFAIAASANAQSFTGSVGIQEYPDQSGSYTATSLTLDALNYTEPGSGSGTFAPTTIGGQVPNGTGVSAYSTTIGGLSSAPLTLDISDFLTIGTPGPLPFGSTGTSPNNRFDFELLTLAENNSSTGYFTGTGILTDTTGAFSPTSAQLLLTFSGANNYSFTLQAVPEPATVSLVGAGLLGAFVLRRRKS